MHMEGGDEKEREYKIRRRERDSGDREKHIENIVTSRTNCVIELVRNI